MKRNETKRNETKRYTTVCACTARIRNASPYAQTEDEIQAVGAAAQRDPAAAEDDDVTVAESMASVTVRPAITKEATQTAGLV